MTYAILKNITPVFFLFIFQLSFASSALNLIKASQNFIEFQKEDKSVEKIIELFSKTSLEDVTNEDSLELSEEEQWKIIQEKLAEQQALLDDRESDPSREDNENE